MFRKNEDFKQYDLFGITCTLSDKQKKLLTQSIEESFFRNIFCKINETNFEVLYSSKKSRPNVPVNQLVGSLILKHLFNWTYAELFRNLNFNILTRHAIGIQSLNEEVYSEASLYNFQNKLIQHFVNTGKDLLSEVFDQLTESQLKEFGVKTNIQRGDSFLMGSNIFDYTRLQLLIEVLLRLYRILEDEDKQKISDIIHSYTKQTAGQYTYKIEKEELPKEIERLASIYYKVHSLLKGKYKEIAVFSIFERVFNEHFTTVKDKVNVIPSNKLDSSVIMSPDDTEAAYRKKGKKNCKGYVGHITETANPDNSLNLITDVAVAPCNTDDAKILEKRLPEMIDKTPDLDEYHCDGNYGSPEVDKIMDKNKITQIQTAVRGRKLSAKREIICAENNTYWVKCEGGQLVKAEQSNNEKNSNRYKAIFDHDKCLVCECLNRCKIRSGGTKNVTPKKTWYFNSEKILLHKRMQNIHLIPKERHQIRANVEATVKEVKRGIKAGKLRIRKSIRVLMYLYLTSAAVNLTRIHKKEIKLREITKNCILKLIEMQFDWSIKKFI